MWTSAFAISGVAEVQTAVVDTGTTLIVGPHEFVMNVLTAAGMETRTEGGLLYGAYHTDGPTPYVAINIAGLNLVLSGESLAYRNDGPLTIAGIAGRHGMDGWWVLGDTFLQNVYAVFDAEGKRMGFAPH